MVVASRVVVALIVCATPLLASASPSQRASAGDAHRAFERAVALYRSGHFERALPYFETSVQLSGGRPAALLGLAQCERALGRVDEAIEHFEAFARLTRDDVARTRAIETVALLRRRVSPPATKLAMPRSATAAFAILDRKVGEPVEPALAPTAARQRDPVAPNERGAEQASHEDSSWATITVWTLIGVALVASAVAVGVTVASGEAEIDGGTTGVVVRPLGVRF